MSDTNSNRKANRLIHSASPYLLQHAYNPVDWYEWGDEALGKALAENKPILVSIGYSSCHWCHVMERESFEDPQIAELMNGKFVCIKVDREERPDIDQIYMDAVHAMGMHGGWPLNVFLTPQQQPFYGGTYFPPQNWHQLLTNIDGVYHHQKEKVNETAAELTRIISSNDTSKLRSAAGQLEFRQAVESTYKNIEQKFDYDWGGVDKVPKFIMPTLWLMLLRMHHLTGNENAFKQTDRTLMRILDGGIYDQVGGGFARYSVDREWFVPHFEKMLYDNAQLMSLYAEAYSLTNNPDYKRVVYETFHWLQREMSHADGAFYSALDADSEGVEGKFYSWTKNELEALLKEDAALFCEYFGVTADGNWEHQQNILKRVSNDEGFLARHSLHLAQWDETVEKCKQILRKARENRIRPGLDDKVVTGWNAMMICGLVDAFHAFGDDMFLASAKRCMEFLNRQVVRENIVHRTFKGRHSDTQGFLEDYAYLISACVKLYQAEFNEAWLSKAEQLTNYVCENFLDSNDGLFFFTASSAEKLIARKKEIFDNVIPSSNSVMAMNLHQLGILIDNAEWRNLAAEMVNGFSHLITSEPNYMSNWAIAYMEIHTTMAEVAIVGPKAKETKNELARHYLPFALWSGTETSSGLPLLMDKKPLDELTTIYTCRNYSCQKPVHNPTDAIPLITNKA